MSDKQLPSEHAAILAEEEEILARVKEAVREQALASSPSMAGISRGILELREQAAKAHTRDLPSLIEQLHVHQSLARRSYDITLPDMRAPYFAHIKIEEQGRIRDILIGHQTFISSKFDVSIIDWRHAPIAKIFFNFRQGDYFEVELPQRVSEGQLIARRLLNFKQGHIVGIRFPDFEYRRNELNNWVLDSRAHDHILAGGEGRAVQGAKFGTGKGGRKNIDVSALLDPHQYRLLEADDTRPLLILGGAGSGKTTVALHRIASLFYKNPQQYPQHKLIVIVPEQGLVRLSRKILDELRMNQVKLTTFDDWISWQGRHILRTLPRKKCQTTPSKVIRFKRHEAIFSVFDELERHRTQICSFQIKRELAHIDDSDKLFSTIRTSNLLERLNQMESICQRQVKATTDKAKSNLQSQIKSVFHSLRESLYDLSYDRRYLFTNKDLLAKIVAKSNGELENSMISQVYHHTINQIQQEPTAAFGIVDKDYSQTLDHHDLRESDDDDVANTIDQEDYPILLELLRRYTGEVKSKTTQLHSYTHMVIDEAQELSPVELKMLGHALEPEGSVTIAGDAVQQTDPTSVFASWDKVLENLGVETVKAQHLETSYRCPQKIMDFAYQILGPLAPKKRPLSTIAGADVRIDNFSSDGLAAMELMDALEELFEREPHACVGIICHQLDEAEQVFESLKELANTRLIREGEFDFKPGIDVTDVSQTKGLEFDYVIIPDANHQNYPETPEARRALHVAATRAIHQLWVIAVGTPSPLIVGLNT